jgi:hypothetical protein
MFTLTRGSTQKLLKLELLLSIVLYGLSKSHQINQHGNLLLYSTKLESSRCTTHVLRENILQHLEIVDDEFSNNFLLAL